MGNFGMFGWPRGRVMDRGPFSLPISESIGHKFPIDAGGATTDSAASTSHSLNLPSDIAVGDVLIAKVRMDANTTITLPTDWIEVYNNGAAAGPGAQALMWKLADGSEGATATITLADSLKLLGVARRITGAGRPFFGAAQVTTSQTPNPVAIAPGYGVLDYLVMVWGAHQSGIAVGTPHSLPKPLGSGCVVTMTELTEVTSNPMAYCCSLAARGESFDPGTGPNWGSAQNGIYFTVAIPPAGSLEEYL